MGIRRPMKVWKLNYWKADPEFAAALTVLGDPAEVRLAAADDAFISLRSGSFGGMTFSPGFGKRINIQALSGQMRYGGMIQDLPFPLSIIPVTPFTPFPNQNFRPPLENVLPAIRQFAIIASSAVGL